MSNEQETTEVQKTIENSPFLLKHHSGIDLADRFENILQRQFDSLANIENKAWKTIGAITSVIGILIAGFSLLVKSGNGVQAISLIDVIPLLIGISFLFASIVYCIFSLVSTEAVYGPATELGDKLTDGDIDREYTDFVLRNYKNAISDNWNALNTKSEHLRKSFSFLVVGLLFSTSSFLLIIYTPPENPVISKFILLVGLGVVAYFVGEYIWNKKFQPDS